MFGARELGHNYTSNLTRSTAETKLLISKIAMSAAIVQN